MRRRPPPPPREMPAWLRCFDPAEWGAGPDAHRDSLEMYEARKRYNTACSDWCQEHGVNPLAVIRQRRQDRHLADGAS